MSKSTMPVEALMTRNPVTVYPMDAIRDALALLERYPFRHLPVADGNRLVGMVSDRDLAFAVALPRGRRAPGHGPRRRLRVEEIMRRPVHTVAPHDPAHDALRTMLARRIGATPVAVGDELLGIVTETDFLRAFARGLAGAASEGERVGTWMSTPVVTAAPDEDLLEAAERLHDTHVRHLPVVEGDELLGMLSDRDLRRALAQLAREDRRIQEEGSSRIPRFGVGEVMSTPCLTIADDRPLRAAADVMIENRIGALAVVRSGRLVGIISQRDLLERYPESASL